MIIQISYRFEALAKLNQNYFVKNTREICLLSDALEGIPSFELQDQFIYSLSPMKIPAANERKALARLAILKSFAEQFSQLRRVQLPSGYHMEHKLFNKASDDYREEDL
jgi:hypothetical protein